MPRGQVVEKEPPPEKDGYTLHLEAERSLERIANKFHEAWDVEELTLGERHVRARDLLRGFGTRLFAGADTNSSHGNRQRKRDRYQAHILASTATSEILSEVSPVDKYDGRLFSSAYVRTEDKKADKNGHGKGAFSGGQNGRLLQKPCQDLESTTYGWSGESSRGRPKELQKIDLRREEIRQRFIEIQPADGHVFVHPANSDEVIRLAEELDEMDRQEAALLADEFYPAIVPSGPDPLVDGLLEENQMEGYV